MNERAIEDIKNALREVMTFITQRGEPLSENLKIMIARVMEHVANRITELRAEEGEIPPEEPTEILPGQAPTEPPQRPQIPTGGPIPNLDPVPHESSNVYAVKYEPNSKELFVKFNGKDTRDSGPVYAYQGVNPNIFSVILRGGVAPLTSGRNKYHAWHAGITPSHGASVNALLVKGQYPYQRIS